MTTRDAFGRANPGSPAALVLILIIFGLAGCAGTRVVDSHPRLTASTDAAAQVYFIRPNTERYMGYADNTITIEADGDRLLELVKGEYTLVSLQPGKVVLTVYSDTNWGPEFEYKEMVRSRELTLEPGQTHFIALIPVDGEFRGVHFEFETVDLRRARELSRHLRVVGAADSRPIGSL